MFFLQVLVREPTPPSVRLNRLTLECFSSRYGFIAQEIEEVLPNLVHKSSEDGMLSLRMEDLIAVVTLGIQSVDNRVLRLDDKLSATKSKVEANYMDVSEKLRGIETAIRKMILSSKKKSLASSSNATGMMSSTPTVVDAPTLSAAGAVLPTNATNGTITNAMAGERRTALVAKIQVAVTELYHKNKTATVEEGYEVAKRQVSKFVLDELAQGGVEAVALLEQKELLSGLLEEALTVPRQTEENDQPTQTDDETATPATFAKKVEQFSEEERSFFRRVWEYAAEKLVTTRGGGKQRDEIYA